MILPGRVTGLLPGLGRRDHRLADPGDAPTVDDTAWTVLATDDAAMTVSRAHRAWTVLAPGVVVIVDEVVASRPVEVLTHFATDVTEGGATVNRASASRLVLRRRGLALKLLGMAGWVDGSPVLPEVLPPAREGGPDRGPVHTFTTLRGRRHRAVYTVIADDEPRIRGWHATLADNGRDVTIEDPEGWSTVVSVEFGAAHR